MKEQPAAPAQGRPLLRMGPAYEVGTAAAGVFLAVAALMLLPGLGHALMQVQLWQAAAVVAALAAGHELAHAGAYRLLGGRRLRFGVNRLWGVLPVTAWCELGEPLSRPSFLAVLAAPQIAVMGTAALLPIPLPLAALLIWLNLAGGGGDLVLAFAVLASRARVIQDGPEGAVALR